MMILVRAAGTDDHSASERRRSSGSMLGGVIHWT
jgi:hypothetical protein